MLLCSFSIFRSFLWIFLPSFLHFMRGVWSNTVWLILCWIWRKLGGNRQYLDSFGLQLVSLAVLIFQNLFFSFGVVHLLRKNRLFRPSPSLCHKFSMKKNFLSLNCHKISDPLPLKALCYKGSFTYYFRFLGGRGVWDFVTGQARKIFFMENL